MANEVAILVKSDDQTAPGFESASQHASGFGNVLKGVVVAGAAAAAGGLLAAGKVLYDTGAAFDSVSDTIRVGTGATGDALDGLVADAKAVGQDVPASFEEIGTAIAALKSKLDITGEPLQDMAAQFLNLSRITGTDLSANIENITRVFGDWGIATEDQAATMDELLRASQVTGAGIDGMAAKVVQFGAPLRQMGFSFEESIAMLGKFEKEGVNTELVMGSLRIALGKLAKDGKEPVAAFREQVQAIKDAGDAGKANTLALELFGAKAGTDMAAAIREGRFAIDDLVNTITNGSDTIDQASQDTMDFAESWQLAKNRMMTAVEPIASRVFGAVGEAAANLADVISRNMPRIEQVVGQVMQRVGEVMDRVGPILESVGRNAIPAFRAAADAIVPFVKALAGGLGPVIRALLPILAQVAGVVGGVLAAAFAVLGPPIRLVGEVLGAILSALTPLMPVLEIAAGVILAIVAAVRAWAIAQALLNAVMYASPVTWFLVALAALVVAIMLIIKHWDAVKEATAAAWEFIKSVVSAAVDWVVGFVRDHWQLLLAIIAGPLGIIIGLVIKHWDQVKAFFVGGVQAVLGIFSWLGQLPGMVAGFFSGVVSAAAGKINELIGWVQGIPGRIRDALGDLGSLLRDAGRRVIQSLIDGIMSMLNAVRNAASSVASAVTGALPFSPAKFGPLRTHPPELAGQRIAELLAQGLAGRQAEIRSAIARLAEMIRMDGLSIGTPAIAGVPAAPRAAGGAQGSPVLQIAADGSRVSELLLEVLRDSIKVRGGNVQLILGRS